MSNEEIQYSEKQNLLVTIGEYEFILESYKHEHSISMYTCVALCNFILLYNEHIHNDFKRRIRDYFKPFQTELYPFKNTHSYYPFLADTLTCEGEPNIQPRIEFLENIIKELKDEYNKLEA